MQRHAYMLRVAIPYGLLASKQMRMLAHIARTYDRGYGHFTTRQNIQFNWMELERVPDILDDLASVEMHGIQTSGNCIRNITTDQFAGVAPTRRRPARAGRTAAPVEHVPPEFAFLPRKFKIAISASAEDRAVVQMHDIGLYAYKNAAGETRLRILAGGGWAARRSRHDHQGRSAVAAHADLLEPRSACTTATAAATTSTRRASRSW
jgi:sulfite reductase (NADPH) hemoprotein beta-component